MEEKENKEEKKQNKLAAFFSVKRNKIIACAVGGALVVGIILAVTISTAVNKKSSKNNVEMTAEKWDAAFNEVPNNFTFKCDINNVTRGLVQLNDDGIHTANYDSNGNIYKTKEDYIDWTKDKKYIYSYNDISNLWEKSELTNDEESKEYYINYYKIEITFIGRFSDFSYDADKGGYYASTTKTYEYSDEGEINGGYEVKNVLVVFENNKITQINFQYDGDYIDGDATANYSVTSIGTTTFTFPTIYE